MLFHQNNLDKWQPCPVVFGSCSFSFLHPGFPVIFLIFVGFGFLPCPFALDIKNLQVFSSNFACVKIRLGGWSGNKGHRHFIHPSPGVIFYGQSHHLHSLFYVSDRAYTALANCVGSTLIHSHHHAV
ncbi:HNH endonuclease (plasmid) [Piscirickettsia salmonis]|uniref:HNH endonuclease n=1 Tax=Piscirickettsia salmonis TaxID=1238 RepID=A0AAC8ZQB2_PISSA|nr:HNH endonuclease [Piscirickettsia salmonis]